MFSPLSLLEHPWASPGRLRNAGQALRDLICTQSLLTAGSQSRDVLFCLQVDNGFPNLSAIQTPEGDTGPQNHLIAVEEKTSPK